MPTFTLDSHSVWYHFTICEDQFSKEILKALPEYKLMGVQSNRTKRHSILVQQAGKYDKITSELEVFRLCRSEDCYAERQKNIVNLAHESFIMIGPFEGRSLFSVQMSRGNNTQRRSGKNRLGSTTHSPNDVTCSKFCNDS
jgi:hypothetical protein